MHNIIKTKTFADQTTKKSQNQDWINKINK